MPTQTENHIEFDELDHTLMAASVSDTPARLLVHKLDHEGAIHVDPKSGSVLTPSAEVPAWAEGLTVAHLAERRKYYESRLAPEQSAPILAQELIVADDLSWVGIDADDELVNIEAEGTTRMQNIAEAFGIDLESSDPLPFSFETLAELEIAHSNNTEHTTESLRDVYAQSFGSIEEAASNKASATG